MDGAIGEHGEAVPDLVHPVVGYRSWAMDEEGNLVSPHFKLNVWEDSEQKAECLRPTSSDGTYREGCENAPAKDHVCGLYAFLSPSDAVRYHPGSVLGCVVTEGRLIVHETGYRAEKMRVVGLCPRPEAHIEKPPSAELWLIAKQLDLPIVTLSQIIPTALQHGSPLPESILSEIRERNAEERRKRQVELAYAPGYFKGLKSLWPLG